MANDGQNVDGYAPKSGNSATREDSNQVGARNTARSLKGAAIAPGPRYLPCPPT